MAIGEPKMPTPEYLAKIEKERTLSDAELIKGGAEYKFDEKGNKMLEVTEEQNYAAKEQMGKELNKESLDNIDKTLKNMNPDERLFFNALRNGSNILKETKSLLDAGKIEEIQYNKITSSVKNLQDLVYMQVKDKLGEKKVSELIDLSYAIQRAEYRNKLEKNS